MRITSSVIIIIASVVLMALNYGEENPILDAKKLDNPVTRIKFDIPQFHPPLTKGRQGGFVVVKIFDVLGSEVAALINESLKPGTYKIEWDAANFPSGVYFYKLTAGTFTESKKMILLK